MLAYLGRGGYFGEIGLLGRRTAAGRRVATALDHVEVVRIGAEDFNHITEEYPEIRRGLELVAEQHLEQNKQRLSEALDGRFAGRFSGRRG